MARRTPPWSPGAHGWRANAGYAASGTCASVTGFSRVGDVASLPIDRADNTYQIGDNLTLIRGAHSVKIGGEFRALEICGEE